MVDPSPTPPQPARRVRVVLADLDVSRSDVSRSEVPRQSRCGDEQHRPGRAELVEQSPLGQALLSGLIRAKLAAALRLAAVVAVGLGGLPLLFAVAPGVAAARPFGIALPWLLLGVAAYPFLVLVGAGYVHVTERIETEFTELVERPER